MSGCGDPVVICGGSGGSGGGGVMAVVALVGLGVFVWLNIVAIITFLLLLALALVLLTVAGVGAILFLQKFMIPRMMPNRVRRALADTMSYTATERSQTLQIEAEVVDDGVPVKGLEGGAQGRAAAIHGAAREAALSPLAAVRGSGSGEPDGRPEPLHLFDRLR